MFTLKGITSLQCYVRFEHGQLRGLIMTLRNNIIALTSAATLAALPIASTAYAQDAGVQLGQLTCDVDGGTGFVFGSSKDMTCSFTPANASEPTETYVGQIDKYGVDIGFTGKSIIGWTVVAAESDKYAPNALAGTYSGASASAAFAAGLGANVLVGGSAASFALQPLSLSASEGANIAVGFTQITLK